LRNPRFVRFRNPSQGPNVGRVLVSYLRQFADRVLSAPDLARQVPNARGILPDLPIMRLNRLQQKLDPLVYRHACLRSTRKHRFFTRRNIHPRANVIVMTL